MWRLGMIQRAPIRVHINLYLRNTAVKCTNHDSTLMAQRWPSFYKLPLFGWCYHRDEYSSPINEQLTATTTTKTLLLKYLGLLVYCPVILKIYQRWILIVFGSFSLKKKKDSVNLVYLCLKRTAYVCSRDNKAEYTGLDWKSINFSYQILKNILK